MEQASLWNKNNSIAGSGSLFLRIQGGILRFFVNLAPVRKAVFWFCRRRASSLPGSDPIICYCSCLMLLIFSMRTVITITHTVVYMWIIMASIYNNRNYPMFSDTLYFRTPPIFHRNNYFLASKNMFFSDTLCFRTPPIFTEIIIF